MEERRKIDLALEARELAESAGALDGVRQREEDCFGLSLTRVEILSPAGARALGKPEGCYLTLSLPEIPRDRPQQLRAARAVAAALGSLKTLPREGTVLVAGLGNRQVTPDAIGPRTAESLLVTRHLLRALPERFSALRPVAALETGVAGTTGMESGELIRGAVETLSPVCLIAVDALAARRQERVCRCIQLSDTGIVPGSGVGNARMALNRESLGIPVIAVGVPTVVDAATLCLDLLEESGRGDFDPAPFRREGAEWFLTPRSVDREVACLSRVLGLGISAALHVDFSVEDVEQWTA